MCVLYYSESMVENKIKTHYVMYCNALFMIFYPELFVINAICMQIVSELFAFSFSKSMPIFSV